MSIYDVTIYMFTVLVPSSVKLIKLKQVNRVTYLMCKIVIWMVYAKEVFNMLADRFIRIWGYIPHKYLLGTYIESIG